MPSLPSQTSRDAERTLLCPRVSTDKQWDGTSIETQEAAMRRHCAERGWTVAGVLADAHSGASLWERPQFKALSARVQAASVDRVLFYETGRLARDQAYAFIVLELCERFGVRLEFVLRDYDRRDDGRLSTLGRFLFGAEAFVAEKERHDILERTSRGKSARIAAGTLIAQGRPPYGYRRVEIVIAEPKWSEAGERLRRQLRQVRYEEDTATAPVVRRIVRMFLIEGCSLRAITSVLTDEGVPTPSQHAGVSTRKGQAPTGVWRTSSVRRILLDSNYYGSPAQRRWRVAKTSTGKPTVVPRDPSEHAPITDGSIPPLLPPELCGLYAEVAARLTRNRQMATRNHRNPESHLLRAGIARCGYCDAALIASPAWRGVGPQYKCGRGGQVANGCRKHAILASALDGQVWAWVEEVLDDPDRLTARASAYKQRDEPLDVAELEATEEVIRSTAADLTNLAANLAKVTGAAADAVTGEMNRLSERLTKADAAREALRVRIAERERVRSRAAHAVDYCRRVARNVEEATYANKRLALEALNARVRVWGTDHEPRFDLAVWIPTDDEGAIEEVVFTSPRTSEHNCIVLRWAAGTGQTPAA